MVKSATSIDELNDLYVVISNDEEALTNLLKQRHSITHKQTSDIARIKIELFDHRNKYKSFVNSNGFSMLKKVQQESILKRLQTISVMYSETCIEWDRRKINEYNERRRKALCI